MPRKIAEAYNIRTTTHLPSMLNSSSLLSSDIALSALLVARGQRRRGEVRQRGAQGIRKILNPPQAFQAMIHDSPGHVLLLLLTSPSRHGAGKALVSLKSLGDCRAADNYLSDVFSRLLTVKTAVVFSIVPQIISFSNLALFRQAAEATEAALLKDCKQ